ncbi:MAG: UDP-3-O-(3-hydroxymyristoyl)glucosamine N-acyltransferase [Pseudomonadota bacterium]|nr:UDP-3-O-(3-hydroxymyristoyl)glucosamine N-acyltransferase [Pseudomonadota bacterium]
MADPRFFRRAGPFTLWELAEITGARLSCAVDASREVMDVAPLDRADSSHVGFICNRKYLSEFRKSRAGACFASDDIADQAPAGMALLLSDNPYKSYALAASAFYPEPALTADVHSSAVVEGDVDFGPDCVVSAGAVIGTGVKMGARCVIGSNAVIGENVILGDDVRIDACVSVSHALIGSRVTIYPGARIGQDGFGFAIDPAGYVRVPQLGRVIVEDDVEIGANTTVDRGSGPDTVIRRGAMIDNLVQIAHNVEVGQGCVIAAMVGISGSTRLESSVFVGGQSGIAGHLVIGRGARISAQSGVTKSISAGRTVTGAPATDSREFNRRMATLAKITKKNRT